MSNNAKKYEQETFGFMWYVRELRDDIVCSVQNMSYAFNLAVSEKCAGRALDKKITKARLSLVSGKGKQNRIKKRYGIRCLFRKESEYASTGKALVQLGKQKISEAQSKEQKQQIAQEYGRLCFDNNLKLLNVMALSQSKEIGGRGYIPQRDQWQKVADFYLKGKIFKNTLT
jgi:RNase P protein component